MTLFRRDPYLWVHLAGLAALPLWLDVCFASFAGGGAIAPPWLELGSLALVGTTPILWMQWQRPFYIFSLLVVAIRPDLLSEERRRLLALQRTWQGRSLTLAGAIALLVALVYLYVLAPIAAETTPLIGLPQPVAWLICAISFLFANLFIQVPASVIPLLITSASTFRETEPYDPASIPKNFTVIGLRVSRILPELAGDLAQTAAQADSLTGTTAEALAETTVPAESVENESVENEIEDISNEVVEDTSNQVSDQLKKEGIEISSSPEADTSETETSPSEAGTSSSDMVDGADSSVEADKVVEVARVVEAEKEMPETQNKNSIKETETSETPVTDAVEMANSLEDVLAETESLPETDKSPEADKNQEEIAENDTEASTA